MKLYICSWETEVEANDEDEAKRIFCYQHPNESDVEVQLIQEDVEE
jgi:hypothetical protein